MPFMNSTTSLRLHFVLDCLTGIGHGSLLFRGGQGAGSSPNCRAPPSVSARACRTPPMRPLQRRIDHLVLLHAGFCPGRPRTSRSRRNGRRRRQDPGFRRSHPGCAALIMRLDIARIHRHGISAPSGLAGHVVGQPAFVRGLQRRHRYGLLARQNQRSRRRSRRAGPPARRWRVAS